jgi:hypothetical protein
MKNNNAANNNNNKKQFALGSARVKISDARFGERFLGGEDFCVFASVEKARAEVSTLLSNSNSNVIDEWEIHQLSHTGDWYFVAAGLSPKALDNYFSEMLDTPAQEC